ncbi:MAG: protein kinase [Proteobacteria bacterium]|nr:protein kinase [Pseudomonadota bacterium]
MARRTVPGRAVLGYAVQSLSDSEDTTLVLEVGSTRLQDGLKDTEIASSDRFVAAAQPSGGLDCYSLESGQMLGRYELRAMLGQGGMGTVYAANDTDLHRTVAIKVLRTDGYRRMLLDGYRKRLRVEAQAMARLNHPNVITIYEVGTADGRDFIAMEYVEGVTLEHWLRHQRPAWREVLDRFIQAGRGLFAAHQAGLVHRDFKPANVLLGSDGRVLVTDFGLARMNRSEEEAAAARAGQTDQAAAEDLTQTGAVLGTPAYMAPEQHRGLELDGRSDQYSFAVALYEGLYGQSGFPSDSTAALHRAKMTGTIAAPPAGTAVPGHVHDAVLRGLQPDPARRFSSMHELVAALEYDPRKRRAGLARTGLAGLVVAALIAVLALQLQRRVDVSMCEGLDSSLAGVWDDEVKNSIRRAFVAADPDYGPFAFRSLASKLDSDDRAWKSAYQATCRGERDPASDLRIACLIDYRGQLQFVIARLFGADMTMVRDALPMAHTLPDPAQCQDVEPRLPVGARPESSRQVQNLRTELGMIRMLQELERLDEARNGLDRLLPRIQQIGDRSLLAEAFLLQGLNELEGNEYVAGRQTLDRADRLAEQSADDALRARVLVAMVQLETQASAEPPVLENLIARARAAVERMGGDAGLQAQLNASRAATALASDPRAAIPLFESARAEFERAGAVSHAARALANIAQAHLWLGDVEAAVESCESSEAMMRGLLGEQHPAVIAGCVHALEGLFRLGRYDELQRRGRAQNRFLHSESGRRYLAAMGATFTAGERQISGRVVDGEGNRLSGIEVVISRELIGDGKYVLGGFDATWQASRGVMWARTNARGEFRFTGVADGIMYLAAESGRGRSLPGRVDGSGDRRELELTVRPFGSVRGTVSIIGGPGRMSPVKINLFPVQHSDHGRPELQVNPRDDGTFEFVRVASGSYRVRAYEESGTHRLSFDYPTIAVNPGRTRVVHLTIDLRGVKLHVVVRSKYAAAIPTAQVMIVPARVQPGSVAELRKAVFEIAGSQAASPHGPYDNANPIAGVAAGDIAFTFDSVKASVHTICAIPFGGNAKEAEYSGKLRAYLDQLDVYCKRVDITETPQEQTAILEVAPMKRLEQRPRAQGKR